MELIIKRSKWLRGEGTDYSFLLRPGDQKMCCLGFLGQACGLTDEDMSEVETPSGFCRYGSKPVVGAKMKEKVPFLFDSLPTNSKIFKDPDSLSRTCRLLMEINDDKGYTNEERETELQSIFAKNGITVKFVDE